MAFYEPGFRESDPYVYPGSRGVLRNKWGIRDDSVLQEAEYLATTLRQNELGIVPAHGLFDLERLKAIHAHIFQDVFDWAGEIRTIPLSKGLSRFVHPSFIGDNAERVFSRLAADSNLKGLSRSEFVTKLTHYYTEINYLHPFREGNGRTTQTFFAQLSREAGYKLDFTKVGREEWNEAASMSIMGRQESMKDILGRIVEPMEKDDL
jgi:cell filamentation protein